MHASDLGPRRPIRAPSAVTRSTRFASTMVLTVRFIATPQAEFQPEITAGEKNDEIILLTTFLKPIGTTIETYTVQDKKQVAEFDVQQWAGENPDELEEETTPCPICNSAEREDVLLLCDGCPAAYHTHCIGLDHVPEGDWYCMECAHLNQLTEEPSQSSEAAQTYPRPQPNRRSAPRQHRGLHVRTRARFRTANRQARNAEWQSAWAQFSGRFYEMTEVDLDNYDDEDEDLESYRIYEQRDRRAVQRWQQRESIARRLGVRDAFANTLPQQISQRLQAAPSLTPPPVQETRDERRAWGAFESARDTDVPAGPQVRKRKARSVTASPIEPVQEPERKLKRPRTRRLPTTNGEASTSASSPAPVLPTLGGPSTVRAATATPRVEGETAGPALVSALLKELEPNAHSEPEDEPSTIQLPWRGVPDASSPAISPSPSNHSSPRALSLTPPPLPRGRPTSPTLSLSTHIEPMYPPANYSPNRYSSDHSDSESRLPIHDGPPLELRQPRPRRPHQISPRAADSSPTRMTMTQEEKKNINDIVKTALRPHWHAQKLTTEQYAAINRDISRKLYEEIKGAFNEDSKRQCEKRASQAVAQAVAELSA